MSTRFKILAVSCVAFVAIACGGEKPPIQTVDDTGTAEQDTGTDFQDTGDDEEDTFTGGDDTGVTDTGVADTGGSDTGVQDSGMADAGGDTGKEMDTGPQCTGADEEFCASEGMCVNTKQALNHCGGCDQACPDLPGTSKTCLDGSCSYNCTQGREDADGDLSDPQNSNGCEKEVDNCTPSQEICNGKDDDCNGVVDDPWKMQLGAACQSGMGVCKQSGTIQCNQAQDGVVCKPGPGMPTETPEKTCDGKDNDCDGTTDEGCDDDGDGICDASMTYTAQASCKEGPGGKLDCDDQNADRYPGHPGACDGIDNDCDGTSDDLAEVTSATKATTFSLKEKKSWDNTQINPLVVAEAGKGFCGAFFGDKGNEVEFFHLKADGTLVSQVVKLTGRRAGGEKPYSLIDAAWSGSDCGVVYREDTLTAKNDDLRFARWEPGTSKVQNVKLTDDTYDSIPRSFWKPFAAVHYVSGRGWVTGYVREDAATDDPLFLKIYKSKFKSGDNPTDKIKVNEDIVRPPSLDIGPAPGSGADFIVAVNSKFNTGVISSSQETRIYSIQGKSATNRKSATIKKNGKHHVNVTVSSHDGKVYVTYHDTSTSKRVVKQLTSSFSYARSGEVASTSPKGYPVRQVVFGAPKIGDWLIEPYQDDPYFFENQGGSGFNFQLKNHTSISGGDELIGMTTDSSKDRVYILSLIGNQPYKTELNAYTCY